MVAKTTSRAQRVGGAKTTQDKVREKVVFADFLTNLVNKLAFYGCIAFAVDRSAEVLMALAGKTTIADIAIGGFLSAGLGKAAAVSGVVATGTSAWALLERRERRKKTEALTTRIRELEQRIDPTRTSSGLTPKGETNPEDL